MKIAAVTEDGKTISQHFGRAPYYLVLMVEEGRIIGQELREKLGHAQFAGGPHVDDPRGRGYGAHAEDRHARMAQTIADCQVLLAGGMGWGAKESLEQRGIRVITTEIADIEQAVRSYLAGTLAERPDLLH